MRAPVIEYCSKLPDRDFYVAKYNNYWIAERIIRNSKM